MNQLPQSTPTRRQPHPSSGQLLAMLRAMKTVRVEDLDHRDWHNVLTCFETLLRQLQPMENKDGSTRGIRAALATAVARAARDQLPLDPTDTEDDDGPATVHTD